MKYISIDIETTGLDTENCQILSIGAVIEDTNNPLPYVDLPKFHVAITSKKIIGEVFALNMNKELIGWINEYNIGSKSERKTLEENTGIKFLNEDEVVPEFFKFCFRNNMVNEQLYLFDVGRHVTVEQGVTYPVLNSKIPKTYLNVAGKNFGTFDKPFLERLPRWKQLFKVRSRILDPAILFTNWEEDESLPGLTACKERAGVSGVVTHNALEDAWDVVQVLRKEYLIP